MIGYGASGTTHDFYCYNSSNQVWDGVSFTSWDDDDYASYRVTATEQGTNGRFIGTAPANTERYEMRQRGASLALSFVVWVDDFVRENIQAKTDLITSGGQLYVSSSSNGMLEATKAYVFAFDRTTGEPKTGDAANITAKWVKDYGTPGNLVGNPTEVEDGVYVFDLTESDRTFSKVAYILPESSTSNIVVRGDPPVYSMIESLVRARTDLITPSTTYVINRISGSGVNFNVVAFVGESHLISIPSSDYSAVELEVVFQNINDNRDVAVIADGSLTKTTTQVSFAMPAKVRAKEQNLRYAVRRLSNNEVLLYGTWEVRPAALKSA